MEKLVNKYKRFVAKVLLLFIIIVLTDQLIGNTIRYFYFKENSGGNFQTIYSIEKAKEDILVFGSSRASHHYVPEVFEKDLKKTFFNTGRDGHYLLFNYGVLKATLSRYTPKIVIFDLRPNDLFYLKTDYDNLISLLPFYKLHPEIRDLIYLRSSVEKIKLFSEIYPFNSELISVILNNIRFLKKHYNIRKGYIPIHGILNGASVNEYYSEANGLIDVNKINALKDIAAICKMKNIVLIFICSPIYRNDSNIKNSQEIKKIADAYQSQFWDFENDSVFTKHPEYFEDITHLNDTGAKIFSKKVAERIESLL